jgi:hypothetical protein
MTDDEEENAVRQLGEAIGYGRVMQLAEQIWTKDDPIGALTVGTATVFLVPCPHPQSGRSANGHCDWCCGSGRVTKKVLKAIEASSASTIFRRSTERWADHVSPSPQSHRSPTGHKRLSRRPAKRPQCWHLRPLETYRRALVKM